MFLLLFAIDFCFQDDMRTYDMECITMRTRGNNYLSLEVPGLAERRPSLVHGDYIFAKLAYEQDQNTAPVYQVWFLFCLHTTTLLLGISHLDKSILQLC